MKITGIETDFLQVPLRRPISLPTSQDPRSASSLEVVLVRIRTEEGPTGLGFTFSLGGGGNAIRSLLDSIIKDFLLGANALQSERIFLRAHAELEGLGFAGMVARAYAAVDIALWDIKGKVAQMPVHQLLGGYRTKLKAIASDTATPALGTKQAIRECKAALDRGAAGVQIEIGTHDPELDAERVRQLREGIPDGAWFEVSACGRYDFSTAAWIGEVGTVDFGMDSFSDPLRPDDLIGLSRLIDRLEVGLSIGALYDRPDEFLRVIDRGGISAIRLDPFRIGGITPSRKIAIAAELRNIAIYPVRVAEIGSHLSAGSVYGRMCEYVDWFSELFVGGPYFENGQLVVSDKPGIGLEVRDDISTRFRV